MSLRHGQIALAAIAALLSILRGLPAAEPASDGRDGRAPLQIVLLKERDLPLRGLNFDLQEALRRRPDVRLHIVDSAEIVRSGVRGDVFCNTHGEIYPVDIEERLFEFFRQGGGLLHLGGAPFQTAMRRRGEKWTEVVRPKEPFDLFRARIGMATYVPPYPLDRASGVLQRFDSALVGSPETAAAIPRVGVTVCSTIPMHAVDAALFARHSTAYLAKPFCREMHCAGWLDAIDRAPILTSLALVKSWGNPYQREQSTRMRPWAIFTGQLDGGLPQGVLDAMIRWLACPVFLRPIDLPLATTRRGETVAPTSELVGRLPDGWRVRGRCAEVGLDDFKAGRPIRWTDAGAELRGNTAAMRITDDADAFLRPVRFEIIDDKGRVRDYAESAVVPWRPEKLRAGPKLAVDGRYLDYRCGNLAAPAGFLVGANWQDRLQYGFTWHNPNGLRVAGDALKMAAAGMRIVRPHYMIPGWMRTTPWQIYSPALPGVYDQFELGPEISERHLRALEAHVMIFNSLGIVFQPTLFTLPPPQMGDGEFWMNNARLVSCPGLVENQKRFSRQVMERLGGIPGISWDLVNEPNVDMTIFGQWMTEMKPLWGKTGQLVCIGGVNGILNHVRLGESADYHAPHCGAVVWGDEFDTGKPNLAQEVYLPAATTPEGEAGQARAMGHGVAFSLRAQLAGFMPWNWNQFYANWRYGSSWVEVWDNDLGCCVHADATPRAGGVVLRNWAAVLDGVAFDQRGDRQVVFLYPQRFYSGTGTVEYLHSLHEHGIPFRAVNDADLAAADLTGAKLIIVPYTSVGWRESTWKRLREFAAAGGAVFAHNDCLMLDEDGRLAASRGVPLREGREHVGAGWFDWTMGWPLEREDLVLARLARVFDERKLERRNPQAIPLQGGGQMRFRPKLRTPRTAMAHDPNSGAKYPDRLEPVAVEIVAGDGRLTRGWSDEGEALDCDGMKFRSPEQLFLIREDSGRCLFWGGEITVSNCTDAGEVALVDPISRRAVDARPTWRRAGGDLIVRLDGRQRLLWAAIGGGKGKGR